MSTLKKKFFKYIVHLLKDYDLIPPVSSVSVKAKGWGALYKIPIVCTHSGSPGRQVPLLQPHVLPTVWQQLNLSSHAASGHAQSQETGHTVLVGLLDDLK